MSAYAALVSLRQILVTVLAPRRILFNTAQLEILLGQTVFLLDFLDAYKANQIAALERKMRDAAHEAEDLIENGILDSDSRVSRNAIKITLFYMLYRIAVVLSRERFGIQFFVAEAILCTMNSVAIYIYFRQKYVFPAINDSQELHRVLYDFERIVKDVSHIKEACGEEGKSSAHAALISLRQLLEPILDSGEPRISRERVHLQCLHDKLNLLLDFLGNASAYNMSTQQNLDATIIDAASKAKKALTEFLHPQKYTLEFFRSMNISLLDFLLDLFLYVLFVVLLRLVLYLQTSSQKRKYILGHLCLLFASDVASVVVVLVVLTAQYNFGAPKKQDLPHAIDDFGMVVTDVMKIKEAYGNASDLPPPAAAASSREDLGDTGKDVLVGLDSAVDNIRERLLEASSERQLSSIVGMGGIGKTTLAMQVFKDGAILAHFDVRAWVTVSQEYSLRHVILCLLDSAQMLTEEKRQDSEEVLGMYLHQHLMYRRYLIIIDDVWDTQICYFLSRFFPDQSNGSRVLLTSRLLNVASRLDPSSRVYQMPYLNDQTSWKLLCTKVFGAESCPTELESIGREIAKSCKGLPLAVVVIGGLLCKDIQIKVWRDVAETLKNQQSLDFNEQCLRILGLSYNHLPHHLRPCLLYIAVFLGDCEIPISRLINLWVAEGFLELHASKTLEDVAKGYLKDLIARNLVSICKRSCNGKIRTCSIHDLLRDVCVQNAHNENFLRVVDSTGERPDESPRRISIHPDALQANSTHDLMKSYGYVRSVVCIAGKPIDNPLVAYLSYVYLRVLDVLDVRFRKFPHQIIRLVRLRYLALYYDGPLPASISKLQNLETLVHHHSSFHSYPLLPWVIWNMPKLRHLYVKPGCYLINPIGYRLPYRRSFLLDLQTLVGIRNFKWTKGIIERIPNLKKLGISYRVSSSVDWSTYQLETLVYLRRLESLKIIIKCDDLGSAIWHDPPKLAFPRKLRKLSLSGCRVPWASMTAIGVLPKLEALKLRCEAFSGLTWMTVEGEFRRLMFLLLEEMSFEKWETDAAAHFPRLQRLSVRSCGMLEEIPWAIGDIPTLQRIELVGCQPCAANSAEQMQQEQASMGNEDIKFYIKRRSEMGENEMNSRNMEAREVGPGVFRVLSDTIRSAGNEIMLAVMVLSIGCFILLPN